MTAFAAIVLALVGLGAFLLSGRSRARPATQDSSRPAPATAAPATTGGAPTPTPAPAATISAAGSGAANIYQWLPFSQAGLAAAASVVRSFAADYATYSYTESAARYVAPMRGLITPQLATTLARAYATLGVSQTRTQQRQSAVGSGEITALRAFGPSSMTFLVTVVQKTTSRQGASSLTAGYAITVMGAGAHWLVSDIEPAGAGNS